jgi:hypothetical protein
MFLIFLSFILSISQLHPLILSPSSKSFSLKNRSLILVQKIFLNLVPNRPKRAKIQQRAETTGNSTRHQRVFNQKPQRIQHRACLLLIEVQTHKP